MATHERQDIRDAVVTLLSGETSAGTRIYRTRMGPPRDAEMPCICVHVSSESVDPVPTAPMDLTRTAELHIEGYVSAAAGADVEAALDALALEIETAIDVDDSLDGTCSFLWMSGTELGLSAAGSRPLGAVRISYDVEYHTTARLAYLTDDLETVAATHAVLGTSDKDDTPVDELTLETVP